jgi:hypothetical protein
MHFCFLFLWKADALMMDIAFCLRYVVRWRLFVLCTGSLPVRLYNSVLLLCSITDGLLENFGFGTTG